MNDITSTREELLPQLALLGLGLEDWPRHSHPILTHILIIAHLTIAHKWKSNTLPTLQQAIALNQHMHLEHFQDCYLL